MSLRVPLAVRLRTSIKDIHITDELTDLSFGAAIPGGYTDCTLNLHRPLGFQPREIVQFGRVYVYDARSGETVWEGRLQDPGRSGGDQGEVYSLVAVGGSAHLQDTKSPVVYVESGFDDFYRANVVTPGGTNATGEDPSGNEDAMTLQFPTGIAVSAGSLVAMRYAYIAVNGQKIARVDYDWDAGVTASTYRAQAVLSTGGGASDTPNDQALSTSGSIGASTVVGDFTFGRNTLDLRLYHTGTIVTIPGDQWWLAYRNLFVQSTRFDLNGNEISSAGEYGFRTVLGHQIVKDVLGRFMTDVFDTGNATVATTTFEIERMVYNDGVTAAGVLEDLMKFDDYYYAVWESNPDNDKFRFEWLATPTAVTLEADVSDGFEAPTSGNTVFNRAWVRYTGARSLTKNVLRTSAAPELEAAGFDRTEYIDLGKELGTLANAQQVGDQFLADHRYPTNAGRLILRGPIVDFLTGRMLMPWQVRPGRLIRVRGVEPYPDALNNAGRDGTSVFRIVSTRFSADDMSATLELDSYAPSAARTLARLQRISATRRR